MGRASPPSPRAPPPTPPFPPPPPPPLHGGPAGRGAISGRYSCGGALQQRFGDENGQPHMTLLALAGRNEGRAEFVEQRLGETRRVVGHLALGPFRRPAGGDMDFFAGKR